MSVGDRIKKARKAAKLTQAELAEKSGVAAISIHQYESGKRNPRTEQLHAIADALGVSMDSLVSKREVIIPNRLEATWVTSPDSAYNALNIESSDIDSLVYMLSHLETAGVIELQQVLLSAFNCLNDEGRRLALGQVLALTHEAIYRQTPEQKEAASDGINEKTDN